MRLVISLCILAVVIGCAGPDLVTLDVDGVERSYYVHTPDPLPAGALPVVLALHGGGTTSDHGGRTMGRFTGLDARADQLGFLAVYPNSWGGNWSDGRGFGASAEAGLDDVAYIDSVIEDIATRYDVDRARVYATGASNGGFMTSRLVCERADMLAGAASVIATLAAPLADTCAPARPLPLLFVLGTDDPLVPYAGGPVASDRGEALSADETLARFASAFGCDAEGVQTSLPDLEDDGTRAIREDWRGCADGVRLSRIVVEGGGHTWPGGRQYLPTFVIGATSRDFSAIDEILAAFDLDR